MISVSEDFKTAVKAVTKEIKAFISDGDPIYGSDDLQSLRITAQTSILKTLMRSAEAVYLGSHSYLDTDVKLGIGVVLGDTSTEYIDYGTFKVVSQEEDKATEGTKIKMYDKMYEALITFDLDPVYDIIYPCSLLEFLQAICTRLGWVLATDEFTNDDLEIGEDLFLNQNVSFRFVLDQIAEATGCIIYFDVNDELTLKEIDFDDPLETLDGGVTGVLNSLKVESKFGEINSVVLSRMPQEDNIAEQDDDSIAANGLTEVKIVNNDIVDDDRETHITPIFEALFGLEYYPFTAITNGLLYFQVGDRITVQDQSENDYETILLGIDINLSAGVVETFKTDIPIQTTTPYDYAGIIGQRIANAEIIVNRNTGKIEIISDSLTSVVSSLNNVQDDLGDAEDDISDLEEAVTTLQQDVDAIEITVEGIGGTNLLINSVGLKGNIEDWQILDANGDPVDEDNDGTIDQSSNVANNSESGSAINIQEQYIKQTFTVIQGETYTFYCRYKSTEDIDLIITGAGTTVIPESADWATYKKQFTATGNTITLQIDNTNYAGGDATFADNVCKLGDANGWVQAPNEVYGANFRFDKDGFSITSLTDTFRAVLDNESLTIYDTSDDTIVMQVSKDSGVITDLVVQDSLTLQRYENASNALQMIPTDDGAMFVIND